MFFYVLTNLGNLIDLKACFRIIEIKKISFKVFKRDFFPICIIPVSVNHKPKPVSILGLKETNSDFKNFAALALFEEFLSTDKLDAGFGSSHLIDLRTPYEEFGIVEFTLT